MNKALSYFLLALSLGGNIALVVSLHRARVDRSSAGTDTSGPRAVAHLLRESGFGERVVRFAVTGALEWRDAPRYDRLNALAQEPWLAGSRDAVQQVQQILKEEREEVAAIVPSAVSSDARLNPSQAVEIERIERAHGITGKPITDFTDPTILAMAPVAGNPAAAAAVERDIEKAFGPNAREDYAAYGSPNALIVQKNISGIEVPRATYLALVSKTAALSAGINPKSEEGISRQIEILRAYQTILGDGPFRSTWSTISFDASNDHLLAAKSGFSATDQVERFFRIARIFALSATPALKQKDQKAIDSEVDALITSVSPAERAGYVSSPLGQKLEAIRSRL